MHTKELKPICKLCSSPKWYEDGRLCYNCKHLPKDQTVPWLTSVRKLNEELKEN